MTELRPRWVWRDDAASPVNQYVDFICHFATDETGDVELRVAVDTNFVAWVNGHVVGARAFAHVPGHIKYTALDVGRDVRRGRNTLGIRVYYCGLDHSSYADTGPGLWFAFCRGGEVIACSGNGVVCRPSPAYASGRRERITPQRGFNFAYDARLESDWPDAPPDPGRGWASATVLDRDETPVARPLPAVTIGPRCDSRVIAQGWLKRPSADPCVTVSELMQRDYLSPRLPHELFEGVANRRSPEPIRSVVISQVPDEPGDGVYVVYDLGRQECGLVDIELVASAGTIVDIAVGEHLDDLRVRAEIGGRHFASRYVAREGQQRFVHYMESYAGRYLQVHLTGIARPCALTYVGLRPTTYPLQADAEFRSSESILERIFDVSKRTLHLCMHERYEDCPWREQALYAGDARAEALVGYYTFREYDMARVSLQLMADAIQEDGFMPLCAPGNVPFTIPMFTMGWLLSLAEYILHSGDLAGVKPLLDVADHVVRKQQAQLRNDLLPAPRGMGYWHFYDWADGLVGKAPRTESDALASQRFDAILNSYFVLALRELSSVLEECARPEQASRYADLAGRIAAAIDTTFWDAQRRAYRTYVGDQADPDHYSEFCQSLMVLAGVADQRRQTRLLDVLSQPDSGMVRPTLGMQIYTLEALLRGGVQHGQYALDSMKREWQKMLFAGATSFWETLSGGADMNRVGSLCHGFSASPAYVLQAHVLGIKPLQPGFAEFQVRPVFGSLMQADGNVPTPAGDIRVRWRKNASHYECCLSHPRGTTPRIVDRPDISCTWSVQARHDANTPTVVKARGLRGVVRRSDESGLDVKPSVTTY